MGLNIDSKRKVVEDIAAQASTSLSLVAADFSGLTVADMTALRQSARQENVYLRVAKNSLAKRAFEGTELECVNDHLVGPLVYALSDEDPGAPARVIRNFSKENEKLLVKIVSMGGQNLAPSELDRLAKLPTRDEALAMLVGVIQAPISKLVRTLAAPHTKLVCAFAAVKEQKDQD